MKKQLKIGTRGSLLALWQAEFTKAELLKMGVESELVIIKTQGDLVQNPFSAEAPKQRQPGRRHPDQTNCRHCSHRGVPAS